MRQLSRALFFLPALLCCVGCGMSEAEKEREARILRAANDLDVIREADEVIVYALDPEFQESGSGLLHNWTILEQADAPDSLFPIVAEAIEEAIREGEEEGISANCFDPRHAVRGTIGDRHVDFVICFACSQVEVYRDDTLSGGYLIGGSVEPIFGRLLE